MKRHLPIAALAATLACGTQAARAGGLVELAFNPADFPSPTAIDNPYWPLAVGTHFAYSEVAADECKVADFSVTPAVKNDFSGEYAGLSARVILDREWLDFDCDGGRDRLEEDTFDWYAQDASGNIWYFGEYSTSYHYDEDGNFIGTSTDGSWEAGVDGAQAGLIMLAAPAPGLFYRQEYYAGYAEDMGKVLKVGDAASIGLGDYDDCIVIKDWNLLSPGSVEHKHYCAGTGLVLVEELSGGKTVHVEAVEINLP